MDIETLRLFREVAARGSMSEVARHSYLSQQALSRKMSALEAELGQQLLVRGMPLGLTPAGKAVLHEANAMLAAHERMARALEGLKGRACATVRVRNYGTGSFAGLYAGVLERLAATNPEIDICFVRDNNDDVEMLRRGDIDLGFVRTVTVDGQESLVRDDTCEYLPLRSDVAPLIFGVAQDHPLATLDRPTLAQVAAYPLAMPTDTDMGALPAAVKRLFADCGLAPAIESVWCNSATEHFFEYLCGMGRQSVAFFTDWSFEDFVPGGRLGTRRLTRLVPGPQTFEVHGYAVCLRKPPTPAVRTVLDAARAVDEELAGGAGTQWG